MPDEVGSPSSFAETRMLPALTDKNRYFWTGGAQGELQITRCQVCRRWLHPRPVACPSCLSTDLEPETTSGKGTVFSYTIARHAFNPKVPVPYVIALVELPEQPALRLTTNIVGCEVDYVDIGMPVRVTFEDHGEIFVPLFEPDDAAR